MMQFTFYVNCFSLYIVIIDHFIIFIFTAAALDPRFKLDWVSLTGQKEKDVLDAVKAELELRYRNMNKSDVIGTEAVGTVTNFRQTPSDKANSMMEDVDTK